MIWVLLKKLKSNRHTILFESRSQKALKKQYENALGILAWTLELLGILAGTLELL